MIRQTVSSNRPTGFGKHSFKTALNIPQAQQIIYDFLLEIVKVWPPKKVLEEFYRLFITHADSVNSDVVPALHIILFANDEQEFRNTLKRSCYILINNWEMSRQAEAIPLLVRTFENPLLQRKTLSPTLKRLRQWLNNFIESSDFKELQILAHRLAEEKTVNRPGEWITQYTPYLLVAQYVDSNNPIEQREVAQKLSKRLKEQFKHELAMYTAYSESTRHRTSALKNPTVLGDEVLRLVKMIVAKRGEYSYKNLAHIFLNQVKDLNYANFKSSLLEYLMFSVKSAPFSCHLKEQIRSRLNELYPEFKKYPLDRSLILRTCDRLIDALMTEDRKTPSSLFVLMLSDGNSLTLAIILLKLILISPSSLPYLETRVADLIRYYEQFTTHECSWVISFLEVFRVTFAIYADNVEYNLINMDPKAEDKILSNEENLHSFRIYSQFRGRNNELEKDQDLDQDDPNLVD